MVWHPVQASPIAMAVFAGCTAGPVIRSSWMFARSFSLPGVLLMTTTWLLRKPLLSS